MENFWQNINKPFFTLAPMEDVTDTVFREIVLGLSTPGYLHAVFAEFTSTDGLCHDIGRKRVSHRLFVNNSERKLLKEMGVKIVAQIWGSNPEHYRKSVKMICEEYDFDGIDINMGCPVKKIVKQVSCSELIKYPDLAKEIVFATKEASTLPVSIKTRTGIKEHITEEWIGHLLETRPAAIILHGRTQKMMSKKPAVWGEIKKAVDLKNSICPEMPLLGNGDVFSMEDAQARLEKSGADGVMIGRGIFSDPWIYNKDKQEPSTQDRIETLLKHTRLFLKTWGDRKNFAILKKFFKIYMFGFPGAAELRGKLMQTNSLEEVERILVKSEE